MTWKRYSLKANKHNQTEVQYVNRHVDGVFLGLKVTFTSKSACTLNFKLASGQDHALLYGIFRDKFALEKDDCDSLEISIPYQLQHRQSLSDCITKIRNELPRSNTTDFSAAFLDELAQIDLALNGEPFQSVLPGYDQNTAPLRRQQAGQGLLEAILDLRNPLEANTLAPFLQSGADVKEEHSDIDYLGSVMERHNQKPIKDYQSVLTALIFYGADPFLRQSMTKHTAYQTAQHFQDEIAQGVLSNAPSFFKQLHAPRRGLRGMNKASISIDGVVTQFDSPKGHKLKTVFVQACVASDDQKQAFMTLFDRHFSSADGSGKPSDSQIHKLQNKNAVIEFIYDNEKIVGFCLAKVQSIQDGRLTCVSDVACIDDEYRSMGLMPMVCFRLALCLKQLFPSATVEIFYKSIHANSIMLVKDTEYYPKYIFEGSDAHVKDICDQHSGPAEFDMHAFERTVYDPYSVKSTVCDNSSLAFKFIYEFLFSTKAGDNQQKAVLVYLTVQNLMPSIARKLARIGISPTDYVKQSVTGLESVIGELPLVKDYKNNIIQERREQPLPLRGPLCNQN